mgnify:CR=1 FL=1
MGAASADGRPLAALALAGLLLALPLVRRAPLAGRFLDAVSAASVGLTAAVFLVLARATVVDWRSAVVAVASGAALWRWQPPAAWLVLGGALLGRVLVMW